MGWIYLISIELTGSGQSDNRKLVLRDYQEWLKLGFESGVFGDDVRRDGREGQIGQKGSQHIWTAVEFVLRDRSVRSDGLGAGWLTFPIVKAVKLPWLRTSAMTSPP
jgi:hypothetical protein